MEPSDLTRVVRTSIIICPECQCWIWQGSTDSHGYGKIRLRQRSVPVHIYVWRHFHGPIPDDDDWTLDHRSCTSHRCCRPDHLELVTRSVNSTRANSTRHHNLKFDIDGNAFDFVACGTCLTLPHKGTIPAAKRLAAPNKKDTIQ